MSSSVVLYVLVSAIPCREPLTNGRNSRLYIPVRGQVEFGYGDIVLFFCDVGYVVEGTNKIRDEARCQADGKWEKMPVHCESEFRHLFHYKFNKLEGSTRMFQPVATNQF